jgi:hypothetical protein
MNEVVYIVESHDAVTLKYNLLTCILEPGRESEDRADVAQFLVNLERRACGFSDSYLQCARVVIEIYIKWVPKYIELVYKRSCIVCAGRESLCECYATAIYTERVSE